MKRVSGQLWTLRRFHAKRVEGVFWGGGGAPVDVEGVLQLLGEGFDLGALLQQLPAQAVHLVLQDVDVGHTVLQDVQLPPRLPQLQLQQPQLIQPVITQEMKINTSSCSSCSL